MSKNKHEAKVSPESSEELKRALEGSENLGAACSALAKILKVNRTEVAVLRLENNILRFIYPPEFHNAGAIPLSGSAIAGRTAMGRSSFLSNSFARVKHASLFEAMKFNPAADGEQADPLPIQKIMSAPIASSGKVLGVIQVSRKGLDPALAGPDFTPEDLKLLEQSADIFAGLEFMAQRSAVS